MKLYHYNAKTTIFNMRDPADMFYIVLGGSVALYKPYLGGEVQMVATI